MRVFQGDKESPEQIVQFAASLLRYSERPSFSAGRRAGLRSGHTKPSATVGLRIRMRSLRIRTLCRSDISRVDNRNVEQWLGRDRNKVRS